MSASPIIPPQVILWAGLRQGGKTVEKRHRVVRRAGAVVEAACGVSANPIEDVRELLLCLGEGPSRTRGLPPFMRTAVAVAVGCNGSAPWNMPLAGFHRG